jgi:hypothetical protein
MRRRFWHPRGALSHTTHSEVFLQAKGGMVCRGVEAERELVGEKGPSNTVFGLGTFCTSTRVGPPSTYIPTDVRLPDLSHAKGLIKMH